ncbi:Glycine/sarcosine N-methyltransferase [compost metagenome]
MLQITQLNETYDGIYCIGNTLPHLKHLTEVRTFLQATYDKLKEHGTLVIQTVNFEKVLLQQGYSFPVIRKDAFTFTRLYELQNDTVLFTTILEDELNTHTNTLPLYPITKTQLEHELHKCGYHSLAVYGDYAKSPYTTESPGLVIVASK